MNILRKIAPLLIVLAGTISYTGSFSGVFVFDDYVWIVNNNDIQNIWSSLLCSSRPLIGLTFHLNYLIGGLKGADYHAVNLVIHLTAALLLFAVLRDTFKLLKPDISCGGKSSLFAFMVTLIWVVHPLQTESVTYIVQRSESLMGMFYLLTLFCFIHGVNNDSAGQRWFVCSIIACALGMACKPVMVTAPFVVLFYDRMFVSGSAVEALRKHRGVYIGLASTWFILVALLSVPNESSSSAGFGSVTVGPVSYLMTQCGVMLHYIRLAFWPIGLCLDYDWAPAGFSPDVFMKAGVIALFALFFFLLAWRRNPVGFAGLSFFILLIPSSSIIPLSDCAAEHRMYLPLIFIIILALAGGACITRRIVAIFHKERYFVTIMLAMVLVVAFGLSTVTVARNRIYQSEELIWRQVVSLRPDNLRGYLGLGNILLRCGQSKQAESCFERILADIRFADKKSYPRYATEFSMACNNLGVIRFQEGKYGDAGKCFKNALSICPSIDAQRNLQLTRRKLTETK